MTISELKDKFQYWLKLSELGDDKLVDVFYGAIVANLIKGETCNLHIVGPPSSGKTEVIRSLEQFDKVAFLDSVTPHTFISGYGVGKKRDKNKSWIHRWTEEGKSIIAIKEFTGILSMRADDRKEILSQIRSIADGKYDKAFGNEDVVNWEGKLAFISGVTNIIDDHSSLSQVLGERFVYFRLEIDSSSQLKLAQHAKVMAGMEKEMRQDLGKSALGLVDRFRDVSMSDVFMYESMSRRLDNLACLIALCRSTISRSRMDGSYNYVPAQECSPRLSKQLTQLAAGITMVNDKKEIDEYVFNIVRKVAFDTIPSIRNVLLQKLVQEKIYGDRWIKIGDMGEIMHLPNTTLRRLFEDFMVLGIVDRSRSTEGEYSWRLSKMTVDYVKGMEG